MFWCVTIIRELVLGPSFLITVTLASPNYELLDDDHRPKHVAAF